MQRGSAVKEDGAARNRSAEREGVFGGRGPGWADGALHLLLCTSLFQSSPSVFWSLLHSQPGLSAVEQYLEVTFHSEQP